jgi:hypothetical protein
MGQADLSSMGPLMKPLVFAAMRLANKGKEGDKTKKKAEVKMKLKAGVKVKRG